MRADRWICSCACILGLGLTAAAQEDKRKFPGPEEQPSVKDPKVGVAGVLKWSKERLATAQEAYGQTGFTRMKSPAAWDNEVVYYVMVDRFANGDMNNDMKNVPAFQVDQLSSGLPYTVGNWRHGGDLEGLRGRLGYLEHLGVTTIWVSPILLNNEGSPWGYYLSDMSMIDPGFGSRELFRQVVKEAHDKGIRVVLDVITNMGKSQDLKYTEAPSIDETTACVEAAENMYWNYSYTPNETYYNQSWLDWGTQMPPYMMDQTFFQRCGVQANYRPKGKLFSTLPKVYNDSGATGFDAGLLWPEAFSAPDPLPDFATMNKNWQELYTNMMMYWIAFADIDGLRLDAVKYVSADYVAYISTHVRLFAKTLGKDNFFVTGEILSPGDVPFAYTYLGQGPEPMKAACSENPGCMGLVGDCCPTQGGLRLKCCFDVSSRSSVVPKRVSDMWTELSAHEHELGSPGPAMPTFYPTDDHSYMRDVARGVANASAWWTDSHWNLSMSNNKDLLIRQKAEPTWTWQMVDSQDLPRVLQVAGQGDDIWRLIPALTWMFTWYGSPALYYGIEQGLNGQCGKFDEHILDAPLEQIHLDCFKGTDDALKRQDMFTGGPWLLRSAIPQVNKSAMISGGMMQAGAPNWCEEPLLNRDPTQNQVFRDTRALGRIRRSCRMLGTIPAMRAQDADPKVLAYWKFPEDVTSPGPSCALVILDYKPTPSNDYVIHVPSASSPYTYWSPAALGANFTVGQKFVDLLHPDRTAIVQADGVLKVDAAAPTRNSGVFIPLEDAIEDSEGSDWMVCQIGQAELPALPNYEECRATASGLPYLGGLLLLSILGALTYIAVVVAILMKNRKKCGVFLMKVRDPDPVKTLERPSPEVRDIVEPRHVFVAAIEHTIPDRKVKVSAGGLGKVLDQMLREHPPGRLSLVHPKFAGVNYGELTHYMTLEVIVDMQKQIIQVHKCESTAGDIHRVWYLLEHKWFETQVSTDAPYPYPQTKLSVLRFFSLWNQAAAHLMSSLDPRPDVYHCMDYHAAMLPLYLAPHEQVPTIIVLHNADYDGAIETEFINDVFWQGSPALRRLSLIFNLKPEAIREYLTFEGRFNMLWGGIASVEENQNGHGICTVSGKYADELKRERTMFKALPAVLPLDNAIDSAADDGPKCIEELKQQRVAAKKALQEFCGLRIDPDAKILIFIGRWVKQKGVDHIAMITPSLLRSHPEVQIVLAGPPDDACGLYAEELLAPLGPRFPGRLFVCTEFFALPAELRRGAHLCFAPSCSEPFGYVDVEFGLLGVPSVGCAIGGLGKMPGVYFRQQNADSSRMLLDAFLCSVDYALDMPDADYWEMAHAATKATFPFDTWRENLTEAYSQAITHFKPGKTEEFTLWHTSPAADKIRSEISHRTKSRFRRMSAASRMAQQMQVLDIKDDTEFLTQTVTERRVHDIMRDVMAQDMQRGKSKVKDAETLQRNICLAQQRMTERNHVTQWLMKPFARTKYLRIHAVIALCYIISPCGDTTLKAIAESEDSSVSLTDDVWHEIFYGGVAVGSLLWLGLSRAVPPNLLMASSQLATVLFAVLVPSLPESLFANNAAVSSFLALNGVLSASRLLFIIWNFNEDFHGGFQVACKRIGILESLRTASGMLAVILSYGGMEYLYRQIILVVSLSTLILLFKAPHCYCAYSLPSTGYLEGLLEHKSFWLLLLSEMLNKLASYTSQTYYDWWSLNGWSTSDIVHFSMIIMLVSLCMLPVVFGMLTRMSVWGPWAMRDFSCLLPPGALLRALALYDIGHLHHRSYLFAAALIASYCIDVVRSSCIFASMMTILGNKWYALKGCYLVIFLTAVCASLSPYVGYNIAMEAVGASIFDRVSLDKPAGQVVGSLGEAVLWAVGPLAAGSYLLQLVTLRFFNADILTFKGHGNVLPDGSRTGTSAVTVRVPVSTLARIRRAAAAAGSGNTGAGGADVQLQLSEQGQGLDLGDYVSQQPSNGADERRSEAAASSRAVSRVGSMACSEHVSEIEQQILFNLLDRAGSSLPGLSQSRASSASRLGPSALGLGDEDDLRSRSSIAGAGASGVGRQRDPGLVFLRAASELSRSISEVSDESGSSDEDSLAEVAAAGAAASSEVGVEEAVNTVRLGGVCSI